MMGGSLLASSLPAAASRLGCPDSKGSITALDTSSFMWEPLNTTVARVAGRAVDMSTLSYSVPRSIPKDMANYPGQSRPYLQCAQVPDTKVKIEVCVFNAAHTYP